MRWPCIDQVNNGNYVADLLEYALNTGEERKYQVEAIITLLSDASPEHKEQVMTVADQLRQQGMIQGVEKGMEKGIATVARNMIAKGLDEALVVETTGLTKAQLEAIKTSSIIH